MKKLLIGGILALGGLVAFAPAVFAGTYGYINTDGQFRITAAETPQQAINTALDRAPNSGVMAISDTQAVPYIPADKNTELYTYVTTNGTLAIQAAETPQEAINLAENRAPHSGVMLVVV